MKVTRRDGTLADSAALQAPMKSMRPPAPPPPPSGDPAESPAPGAEVEPERDDSVRPIRAGGCASMPVIADVLRRGPPRRTKANRR